LTNGLEDSVLDIGELTSSELSALGPSLFTGLSRSNDGTSHLLDTTMLFAPKSGGVKRYLLAKRAWLARQAPAVRHTLVVPGRRTSSRADGLVTVSAPPIPFGDGYRCPTSLKKWARIIAHLKPDLVEVGDPYVPGHAGLEAANAVGAATVGFCHSDPAALAALHFGEWAAAPAQKRWAQFFSRFDLVIAPSQHIAQRLDAAGVRRVAVQALGVDTELFHPARADREAVRRELGLSERTRLLVFAGRPAREKNLESLVGATDLLGEDYHLLVIGAGKFLDPHPRLTCLDYVGDQAQLTRLIASCDAFVHANENEPFGLVVLEAMAAGLPVIGPSIGGIAENIDETVGQKARHATPQGLADAIQALFERDLQTISQAARTRAEERHSWDRTFRGLSGLYGQLLGVDLMRPAALNA
jgi:alpha-1,6-mannosyltransferase